LRTIDFKIVQWLRRNTIDRVNVFRKASTSLPPPVASEDHENLWKDRKEAENALRSYLVEAPSEFAVDQIQLISDILDIGTIAFVHGPQGSGKSSMLNRALKDTNRYVTPSSNPDIADLSLQSYPCD
jgi:putative ribosome biogenesis GTPase RsgA